MDKLLVILAFYLHCHWLYSYTLFAHYLIVVFFGYIAYAFVIHLSRTRMHKVLYIIHCYYIYYVMLHAMYIE
jgi:hypothetical protein